MKRLYFLSLLLCLYFSNVHSKPILNGDKYLFYCPSGSLSISNANSSYPVIIAPFGGLSDELYWNITQLSDNEYCFQNYVSKQYLRYKPNAPLQTNAFDMVNELQGDKSTSFSFIFCSSKYSIAYYKMVPYNYPTKFWDITTNNSVNLISLGVTDNREGQQFCLYSDLGGYFSGVNDDDVKFGRTIGSFSSFMTSFAFNQKYPAVDTQDRKFFVSLTEAQMGSKVTVTVTYKMKNSTDTLFINNRPVKSGDGVAFTATQTTALAENSMEIRNGDVKATGILVFSCLPLVQVFSQGDISSNYGSGKLAVTEANKPDTTEVIDCKIKIRGGISQSYPKNSYAIKLFADNVYSLSADRTYFGLRSDNDWILDAMYIDDARMRNRVSTDLWNDFSTRPYYAVQEPKMVNGTRGHFVEVFINDSYWGLYCMTEKVDRKQLHIKKIEYPDPNDQANVIQHGGLYKGTGWDVGTFLGNRTWDGNSSHTLSAYDNSSDQWSAFEVKYPDPDDGEPIDWKPIYNTIYSSSYLSGDADFTAKVSQYYDLPVFLDYYLLIELMLATDNQGKNTYMSIYDQQTNPMMTITPWDMDGTWGRRWDGSTNLTYPNQNFDTFIGANEHAQANLYLRLKKLNYDNYKQKLINRYRQLRGSYFDYNSLLNRFLSYKNLFVKSGANAREKNVWSVDVIAEMPFVSDWIKSRLAYLDKQYLGGPYTGLNDAVSQIHFQFGPNPTGDILNVTGLQNGIDVKLFSVDGVILFQTDATADALQINMSNFGKGIYILQVGSEKVKILKN